MNALITYDLKSGSSDHNDVFLAAAQIQGLIFVVKGRVANTIFRLPQSTVWGQFDSLSEANTAFDSALAITSAVVGYSVEIEKRMSVSFNMHLVRSNDSVPVNPEYIGDDDYETALLHQKNVRSFKRSASLMARVNAAIINI